MVRATRGAVLNRVLLDISGVVRSLVKSLSPSASGCGMPRAPHLFGPFRS